MEQNHNSGFTFVLGFHCCAETPWLQQLLQRRILIETSVQCQRFSPLSWQEAWQPAGRQCAGVVKSSISWFGGSQEEGFFPHWVKLEHRNLKAHPHSDTLPLTRPCTTPYGPSNKTHESVEIIPLHTTTDGERRVLWYISTVGSSWVGPAGSVRGWVGWWVSIAQKKHTRLGVLSEHELVLTCQFVHIGRARSWG